MLCLNSSRLAKIALKHPTHPQFLSQAEKLKQVLSKFSLLAFEKQTVPLHFLNRNQSHNQSYMLEQPSLFPDASVQEALQEVFAYESLLRGMQAFLSAELFENILEIVPTTQSVYDFQINIVRPILMHIKQISINQLTDSGLEQLDPNQKYLFISNHRDIVLDSAFINIALVERGFSTCQIAIGDNLMKHRLSELIFKLNKSFVVLRNGSPMDLYRYSVKLSEYIHKTVSEKTDSVWIAQREGRAKDGNDQTQVALLKMLNLSNKGNLKDFFKEFQIVPVSISYEFNPCAVPIAQEYLNKLSDPDFKKSFQEDLSHILLGLKGKKGKVHFEFSNPLDAELAALDGIENRNQQLAYLAQIIDEKIHKNYRLHPINYVAYTLVTGDKQYEGYYTAEDFEQCNAYFDKKSAKLKGDTENKGREYLLNMYANPIRNK